jgi:hypothetical protein
MYRRVVSLLLVPCLLLTQSAALGHAHAGQRAGDAARPHVHVPSVLSHQHGANGSHRHHHDADNEPHAAVPVSPAPAPVSDHDHDAVYVAVDVVFAGRGPDAEFADCCWLMPSCDVAFDGWFGPKERTAWEPHPPPPRGADCPLYVRHLALLI